MYVCISVALVIQHLTGLHHIVICGLPRSTVFFHIISNGTIFRKQVFEHKMCRRRKNQRMTQVKMFIHF